MKSVHVLESMRQHLWKILTGHVANATAGVAGLLLAAAEAAAEATSTAGTAVGTTVSTARLGAVTGNVTDLTALKIC